jgi:FkbM family methyltransferase
MLARATARARRSLGTAEIVERLSTMKQEVEELRHDLHLANDKLRNIERSTGEWLPHNAYLGDHTSLVLTRWGGMLLIDSRESVLGPALLLYGLWEPEITAWFENNVKPGQTVVDVGANVGYYSLLASRLVGPDGRVVGIEAHPRMAELLHRNAIINGRHNVSTHHLAAWFRAEHLTFHLRRHFAANSSAGSMQSRDLADLDDAEEVIEVDALPLDDVLKEVGPIDLVKVDVEGAELQVFSGLSKTIGSNPQMRILFEWSPGQQAMLENKPTALIDLLRGHGYTFRHIEQGLREVSDSELLAIHHGNVLAER